jgi:hypothetical protein
MIFRDRSYIKRNFMFSSIYSNKKGVAGAFLMMFYRLIFITIVAVVILGLSAGFYSYDINVRDVEARLLARNIIYCLSDSSEEIGSSEFISRSSDLFEYCSIKGDLDRYYVGVEMSGSGFETIFIEEGDRGAIWVRDIVELGEFKEYEPGYYKKEFSSSAFFDSKVDKISVEVLINADV